MRIALSIIVKGDEELENLKRCVASFYPYVDGVFITTNGQRTEETKKWAKDYPKISLSHLDWDDDFSKQRNYNFSLIKGYDWIVWADSDDILVGGEHLRHIAEVSLKNNYDCVFFTYYYGCIFDGEPSFENIKHIDLIQKRERLLKPYVFEWKGMLHETPVPIQNYIPKYTYVPYSKEYPILWLHTETERDHNAPKNVERNERNKRILEKQLAKEREKGQADPRTLLYLMKIYVELQDKELWQKCIEMGEEYLSKSGWDEERALALSMMGKCYSMLGDEKRAERMYLEAVREYPYSVLPYLYLSQTYFNQGQYNKMEQWLKTALSIEEKDTSQMNNELEKKVLASQLTLKLQYLVKKDIRKAYKSVNYLYDILPTDEVKETKKTIEGLYEMDLACENIHKFIKYLEKTKQEDKIVNLLSDLPKEIRKLEFVWHYYNKYKQPRVWGKKEICYYATLGGEHFEKWSPHSLEKGIGGSETAVIKLSKEWQKRGFEVTVYADVDKEGYYDGVLWLPYFKFNSRDDFNIFIQWRSSSLAGKIKAKKFFVDLHDLYSPFSIAWDKVDYVFVKSKYHRSLAKEIPDYKFKIISNGI